MAVESGWQTAYIGLGSNLDDPLQQVLRGLDELARLPQTRLQACSSLYASAPMGPQDQPDYVNAVARLVTGLAPLVLLDALQALELAHGRRRRRRWGPRTLDLDLLLYGDQRLDDPRLQLPHPGIAERPFVLHPLQEVAPATLQIPGQGSLRALLQACPADGLERIAAAAPPGTGI